MPILDDKYYIYPFKNRFSNLHIDLAPQMILYIESIDYHL